MTENSQPKTSWPRLPVRTPEERAAVLEQVKQRVAAKQVGPVVEPPMSSADQPEVVMGFKEYPDIPVFQPDPKVPSAEQLG